MKKLFTNYNFEFSTNEKKFLPHFANKHLNKLKGTVNFLLKKSFHFNLNKLRSYEDVIKLTKDEKTKLVHQLKENVKFLK